MKKKKHWKDFDGDGLFFVFSNTAFRGKAQKFILYDMNRDFFFSLDASRALRVNERHILLCLTIEIQNEWFFFTLKLLISSEIQVWMEVLVLLNVENCSKRQMLTF